MAKIFSQIFNYLLSLLQTLFSIPRQYSTRWSPVARASSSEFSANVTDTLGNITIFTAAGDPVVFKDLWDQNDGIAVVALLRHFGCICCWELASKLKEYKEKFDSAGVKLIAIGVGTPDRARILADGLPFPMDCLYADPDRKRLLSIGRLIHYQFIISVKLFCQAKRLYSRWDSLRGVSKNYTLSATPDDKRGVLQQGGMFVFKGKELLYARKDEGTGDHAPLDDVIDICCRGSVSTNE